MSRARSPSISGAADRCSSGLVGALDTIRCTQPTVGASHVSRVDRADDRWPPAQLAHRTVRWILAVHLCRFPRAVGSPSANLAHQTLSSALPDSPVCQARADVGYSPPILFQICFSFLCTVSSTWTNMLVLKKQFTKSRNVPCLWFALLAHLAHTSSKHLCWASNHQNNYRNGPRAHFPFKNGPRPILFKWFWCLMINITCGLMCFLVFMFIVHRMQRGLGWGSEDATPQKKT
jgi:hypothetical protein